MSTPSDRNLLFGLLALKMDFLTRDQLLDGMSAWLDRKADALGLVLEQRGALTPAQRGAIEALLDCHIARHGGVKESLAAVGLTSPLARELERLPDDDVAQTVRSLATPEVSSLGFVPALPDRPSSGRYRRLRPHARGGLGEVSVALDEELRREVALKEMRGEIADHAESRLRFVREAEVTGNLEHPGVVPVYGLGSYADGRPFYAMRFIKGQTLHDAITHLHGTAGGTGLALRSLLTRFVAVCNAMAYAHSRGVIHRDLKPSNVMLGEYGETLVVDWGLAKVLDQPEGATAYHRPEGLESPAHPAPTQAGRALGTPAFMPPEQARGEHDQVNQRSDVFALGATLYALLTGRAPYDSLAQATRAEVTPPRRLRPRVPAALEAVCARAMAAEPAGRYASAKELGEEVERWLADEPVRAYREPWRARAGRWARRHGKITTGAFTSLLVGVAALATGLVLIDKEKRAAEQARQDEQAARVQAQEANVKEQTARRRTREAMDDVTSGLLERFLTRQPRDLDEQQRQFLGQLLKHYQSFAAEEGDDAASRAGAAEAHLRIGSLQLKLQQLGPAETAFRQSRQRYERLRHDYPDEPSYRVALARCGASEGWLLTERGQYADAGKAFEQALAALSLAEGASVQLVTQCRLGLAQAKSSTNDLAGAERIFEESIAHLQRPEARPASAETRLLLADVYFRLGQLYNLWKPRRAEAPLRQAQQLFEPLTRERPHEAEALLGVALCHDRLARLAMSAGNHPRAETEATAAIRAELRLVQAFPAFPAYRELLARTYALRGRVAHFRNKPREAEQFLLDAIAVCKQLEELFPTHTETLRVAGMAHAALGEQRERSGQFPQAEASYRESLRLLRRAPGNRQDLVFAQNLARTLVALAGLLLRQEGKDGEVFRLSDAALEALLPFHDKATAFEVRFTVYFAHLNKAKAAYYLNRFDTAAQQYQKAIDLAPGHGLADHLRAHRANALSAGGRTVEALAAARSLSDAALAGADCYLLALVYARAAVVREARRPLPLVERDAEGHARQAIALLRLAAADGYLRDPRNLRTLDTAPSLAALRRRDDYQAFRATLTPPPRP